MPPSPKDPGAWTLYLVAPSGNRYQVLGYGSSLRGELRAMLIAERWEIKDSSSEPLPLDFFAPPQ